jgi:chemotaxis family two-component system sensor histidine kinase/response regulator PixL
MDSGAPAGVKVLVMQARADVRATIVAILIEMGYEVRTAENGRDALIQLEYSSLPDVIVLDLDLPVMNGMDFNLLRRRNERLTAIPIIVVSDLPEATRNAPLLSVEAVVAKPIDPDELLEAVGRFARVASSKR